MYNSKGPEETVYNIARGSRIGDINRIHIDNRPGFTFVGYFQSKDTITGIEGCS
jgi:hypothetical protein